MEDPADLIREPFQIVVQVSQNDNSDRAVLASHNTIPSIHKPDTNFFR
jgi:hypothetical protein